MITILIVVSPDEPKDQAAGAEAVRPPPADGSARRVTSRELFAGAQELEIEHAGRIYRLRVTRNNKLILIA